MKSRASFITGNAFISQRDFCNSAVACIKITRYVPLLLTANSVCYCVHALKLNLGFVVRSRCTATTLKPEM